jgi:hypothetical protein
MNTKEKKEQYSEAVVIDFGSGKRKEPTVKIKVENNLIDDDFIKAITLLAYIATKFKNIYLGHSYKILYLIDDVAASVLGCPITKLDYRVAQYGPLPNQFYCEINGKLTYKTKKTIARDYIKLKWNGQSVYSVLLADKYSPDMSLFTDKEIDLINHVLNRCENFQLHSLLEYTRYGIIFTYMRSFSLFDDIIGNYFIDFTDTKGVNQLFDEAYKLVLSTEMFESLKEMNKGYR